MGGVVGALAVICLVVFGVFWYRRRQAYPGSTKGQGLTIPFLGKRPSSGSFNRSTYALAPVPFEQTSATGNEVAPTVISDKQRMRLRELENERAAAPYGTVLEWTPLDWRANEVAVASGSGSSASGSRSYNVPSTAARDSMISPTANTNTQPPSSSSPSRTSFSAHQQRPSTDALSARTLRSTEVDELRAQVIGLRQQMDEMRMDRLEPPPTYVSEHFRPGE